MDCIYESLIQLNWIKLNWENSFLSLELCILIFVYDSTKWIWSFRNCSKNSKYILPLHIIWKYLKIFENIWKYLKIFENIWKTAISILIFFLSKKNNCKLSTDQPFQIDLFWHFASNHLINQLKLGIPMTQMIFFTICNHSICLCIQCSVTLWASYLTYCLTQTSRVKRFPLSQLWFLNISSFSFPCQTIYRSNFGHSGHFLKEGNSKIPGNPKKTFNSIHKSKKPLTLLTSHCHLIFSTCNFRFFWYSPSTLNPKYFLFFIKFFINLNVRFDVSSFRCVFL